MGKRKANSPSQNTSKIKSPRIDKKKNAEHKGKRKKLDKPESNGSIRKRARSTTKLQNNWIALPQRPNSRRRSRTKSYSSSNGVSKQEESISTIRNKLGNTLRTLYKILESKNKDVSFILNKYKGVETKLVANLVLKYINPTPNDKHSLSRTPTMAENKVWKLLKLQAEKLENIQKSKSHPRTKKIVAFEEVDKRGWSPRQSLSFNKNFPTNTINKYNFMHEYAPTDKCTLHIHNSNKK